MTSTKVTKAGITDGSIGADQIEDGTIIASDIEDGSIANAKLVNSAFTLNGSSVSLGGSVSVSVFVDWQSVITADGSTTTTAVAGNGYFIDTTSASHTINLPSSPSAGDTIAIKDYAGTFGTNNLTIGRNSENIQGAANDSLLSTNRASIVLVYFDATKGWLYTEESNVDVLYPTYISATGGTETTSGDYKIHTFTGDGCFVVSSLGNCNAGADADRVDYLVVAGGGGGGASAGGGGGAGGMRFSSATYCGPCAAGSALTVSASTYPVTVGSGGIGAFPSDSTSGSNSVFSTITSTGGGRGGSNQFPGTNGSNGGSAGGGSGPGSAGCGNSPATSPAQGTPGGNGGSNVGGGGGGHSQSGRGGSTPGEQGDGGDGTSISISGSSTAYAGGGGGSSNCGGGVAGTGGTGGGANGSFDGGAAAGTANTGGGGGGGRCCVAQGNGGKGIVIIRYKYQ